MGVNGYCDIAYNFLIDRYGQIYEGRAGGISKAVVAAHAGGFNTGSTGVALIGTYTRPQPPPAQWDALGEPVGLEAERAPPQPEPRVHHHGRELLGAPSSPRARP